MALNRNEILNLDVNDSLVEEYLVEAMQNKHSAATFKKQLEAALNANDELHDEVKELRKKLDARQNKAEDVVVGEVAEES